MASPRSLSAKFVLAFFGLGATGGLLAGIQAGGLHIEGKPAGSSKQQKLIYGMREEELWEILDTPTSTGVQNGYTFLFYEIGKDGTQVIVRLPAQPTGQ